MSTLAEIQEAVTGLCDDEKKALSLWLDSQASPELSAGDEQRLLRSLDEASGTWTRARACPSKTCANWSPHGLQNKLVSRPYVIFYRANLDANRVDILRYWHGARGEPKLSE